MNCTFHSADAGDIPVNDGISVTAYQSEGFKVPAGGSCVSETRTCNNGILSGSYTYSACTVALMPDDGLGNP